MASRYQTTPISRRKLSNDTLGKRFFEGTKYPQIPLSLNDTYVYAEQGDRYDQLALQYYGNSDFWWVISIANETLPQNSYFIPLGVQIRIPANIGEIIERFNVLNGV